MAQVKKDKRGRPGKTHPPRPAKHKRVGRGYSWYIPVSDVRRSDSMMVGMSSIPWPVSGIDRRREGIVVTLASRKGARGRGGAMMAILYENTDAYVNVFRSNPPTRGQGEYPRPA